MSRIPPSGSPKKTGLLSQVRQSRNSPPPSQSRTRKPEQSTGRMDKKLERHRVLLNAIAQLKGKEETTYLDENIIRQILSDAEQICGLSDLLDKLKQ